MASPSPHSVASKIRISKVAGRYLLFDLGDVMRLRRTHSMCSVLVGTNPQAPNQNMFTGLPLELLEEEARLLVDRQDAYIVDDARTHLEYLSALPEQKRRAYIEAHMARLGEARGSLEDEMSARAKAVKEARESGALAGKGKKGKRRAETKDKQAPEDSTCAPSPVPSVANQPQVAAESSPDVCLFESPAPEKPSVSKSVSRAAPTDDVVSVGKIHLTPGTSKDLLPSGYVSTSDSSNNSDEQKNMALTHSPPSSCPLYNYLNSQGYFMTPGIRFGGQYSVYPGDPFRFHAHFIANNYRWDQEIDMLELVGVGRLAGAVKKGLLLGGERPGQGAGQPDGRNVRAFCVEWAGM
ncbi:tRNA-splicing endonuclease subunit sen34 [Pyricularia oryzae]|nr:tRNA-splicing endonuclease subunit sen34 [Pyricularia oryzae Y34]KAI7922901.1 tRNA-splicing endonuclease subunit sen34 [Pyricularia oryzae]KAI7925512.1 tRNA-splicing endonuclease subunit sen34 [Pyricularia oryzae]